MTELVVIVLSTAFQLVAAVQAIRLIRATHHRTAWVLIALALVLMTSRRLITLGRLAPSGRLPALDVFEVTGLAISALMLAGMIYVRRYLYDTFAAERILRESEQRYRSLAQNIPEAAVFLFDRNHRYTLAEGPALGQMGLTREWMEGNKIGDSSEAARWTDLFLPMQEEALNGGKAQIEQAYNGRTFSIQFVPLRNMHGEIDRGIGIAHDITCKVKAEQERKAAFDFLQHTIDGVGEPVMVIALNHRVRLMNRVVREAYAADSSETPAMCYALSHHREVPCNDPTHPCPLQEVRRTLMPVTVLHEHQTAQGALRQVEIVASPLFDEKGQLQGMIEASRDITERLAAEKALHRQEAIYGKFMHQSEDAILLTDEEGRLIVWSNGAEKLTGYSREESVGRFIWDIQYRSAPEEYRTAENSDQMRSALQALIKTGKGESLEDFREAVIQRADGARRSVHTLAFSIATDKGFLLGSILRDITELKSAEVELLKLREAVEASGEVVFMTDHDGVITFINPEFTRLYGYAAEEVVGKTTPRILKSGKMPPLDYALFWNAILNQQVVRGEMVNKTKDGRLLTIESSVNPVANDQGQIEGFLAIQRDITERKRTERELNNSEKRFRALIENGVDYISLIGADGRLIWDSPSTSRALGYEPNELLGQDSLQLIHPEDLPSMRERFTALFSRPGDQDRATFRLRHHDGSWRWVEAVVTNLLNEPSVGALVVNYHDITERKQAEAERGRLLSAIENSIDGIAIADENDRFIYENQAHAGIHRLSEGELIGQTWHVLVPGAAVPAIENAFATELRNKDIGYVLTQATGLRKDGSKIPVEFRAKALWDEKGNYAGHICHVFDITERVQAETALRRRAEELETLAHVSAAMRTAQSQADIFRAIASQVATLFGCQGTALALFDAEGEYASVKWGYGAWDSWTGQQYKIAQGMSELLKDNSQPGKAVDLASAGLSEWRDNARDIPYGVCVPLVTSQNMIGALWLGRDAPLADKDMGLLTAIADMAANALQRQALHEDLQSKLKELQEAQTHIIQSEKLAAIGQLISGIAHELNNPLTSVVLYAQMLQRRYSDDGARRDLDKIVGESLRASKIVRGLLDFARQRSPENQPVDVNDIIKDVVELVSYELRAHEVHHTLELSPDVPVTLADAHQLQQVFVNLMNNAWQAISSAQRSGHIWIKTELAPRRHTTRLDIRSTVIRITVQDDGPGIPKDVLPNVFDPFFTTKPEGSGTGLGLSICYGIISKHGGDIWAESEVGNGSRFIIELPIVSRGQEAIDKEGEGLFQAPPDSHSPVLIIDDEQAVLEVLTRALRSKGYRVDPVSDAEAGLKKIAEVDYAAILCDIRMPGVGGPDFHREVRRNYPNLAKRIVFVTGDMVNDKTRAFIENQHILCLTKPFQLDQLYKIVQSIERSPVAVYPKSELPRIKRTQ